MRTKVRECGMELAPPMGDLPLTASPFHFQHFNFNFNFDSLSDFESGLPGENFVLCHFYRVVLDG